VNVIIHEQRRDHRNESHQRNRNGKKHPQRWENSTEAAQKICSDSANSLLMLIYRRGNAASGNNEKERHSIPESRRHEQKEVGN